jgi:phytanoyl-CoA hydroxylase
MAVTDHQEAKAEFDQDGYTVRRGFLDPAETEDVTANLNRYIDEVIPTVPPENAFYEDKSDLSTLKQLPHMQTFDPYFDRMLNQGAFRELAETLLDGEVIPKNAQFLCKPPKIGQATPPHQDGYYFMIDPVEGLTMWLGLDYADEENGCLRYVRGSHTKGLREHGRTQTLGFSQGMTDFGTEDDVSSEAVYTASPGDLLAHHALTVHRADANRSADRPRRAIGFVYLSARAKERTEQLADYRQSLAKDLADKDRI